MTNTMAVDDLVKQGAGASRNIHLVLPENPGFSYREWT